MNDKPIIYVKHVAEVVETNGRPWEYDIQKHPDVSNEDFFRSIDYGRHIMVFYMGVRSFDWYGLGCPVCVEV